MKKIKVVVLVVVFCLFSACSNSESEPHVLIIGDSISLGYTPYVEKILKTKYKVAHNQDKETENNARYSAHTLKNIDKYLNSEPHLVVWNNGLWDLLRAKSTKYAYIKTVADYSQNLKKIAHKIKSRNIPFVFINTTPIPARAYNRDQGSESIVNHEAQLALEPLGVKIYDMHAWAHARPAL